MKLLPLYAILAAVSASIITSAQAQTIYHDSFGRGTAANPVSLYGTSPEVNTTGSTWTRDGNGGVDFLTDGSSMQVSGGSDNVEGNLAFSLSNLPAGSSSTSGTLTLSATVTSITPGGWVSLGFAAATNAVYNNGRDWMLLTPDGAVQAFTGPANSANQVVNTPPTGANSTTALLAVSLNLATNQVTFSENGASLGTFTAGDISSISYLNITDLHPSTGSLQNFDLTYNAAAIPEPATCWAAALIVCAFIIKTVRSRQLIG